MLDFRIGNYFFDLSTIAGLLLTVCVCLALREYRDHQGVTLRAYIEKKPLYFVLLFAWTIISLTIMMQ
jgi:hypothetical protein